MKNEQIIRLKDGRTLEVEVLTYPIDGSRQAALIELWRTEWTTGDYDWLASMNGDYSQTLRIQAVLGRVDGQAAGTASVCYPCQDAEVAVVGSVLTHPKFRGIGIAEHLTNRVVGLSLDAGCRVSYLGATRDPRNVYLRVGFNWWNGGVMRKASRETTDGEKEIFAVGQSTTLRESNWGDLPGFACFVVQPWDVLVLDYPRSLLSGKYVRLQRCVSNFPVVHEEVYRRGGVMVVLLGEAAHRILGFGSLTPEPGEARGHKAVIEACVHDAYAGEIGSLIQWLMSAAADRKIGAVQAFVANCDGGKEESFKGFGLEPVAQFPGQIRLGGKTVDVRVLEGQVDRQT